jgi:hypothetical protein
LCRILLILRRRTIVLPSDIPRQAASAVSIQRLSADFYRVQCCFALILFGFAQIENQHKIAKAPALAAGAEAAS